MITVTTKQDNTGIVIGQGYGEHFIEVPTAEILNIMEQMARAFIELKEEKK